MVLHFGYDYLVARASMMHHPAPDLYMPLRGWTKLKLDLQNQDKGWANILEPDQNGFKGFTCPAPILLQDWNMNGSSQVR